MICRCCMTNEAPTGEHRCSRCQKVMAAIWPDVEQRVTDQVEALAQEQILGPKMSLAYEAVPRVIIGPFPEEIVQAIDLRMGWVSDETEAVVFVPGSSLLSDENLQRVSRILGCHVGRGEGPEEVYVCGYHRASAPRSALSGVAV